MPLNYEAIDEIIFEAFNYSGEHQPRDEINYRPIAIAELGQLTMTITFYSPIACNRIVAREKWPAILLLQQKSAS